MSLRSKKILSFFLSLSMMLSILSPLQSFAEQSDSEVDDFPCEIDTVFLGTEGNELATKTFFGIHFDHEEEGSDLYNFLTSKKVSKILVNDKEVQLRDEKNRSSYVLYNSTFCFFDDSDNPEGTRLVKEFKDLGEDSSKVKVDIFFEKGRSLHFLGKNYTAPSNPDQGGTDPSDPGNENSQDPSVPDEDEEDMEKLNTGKAADFGLIENVAKDSYGIYVQVEYQKEPSMSDARYIAYVLLNGDKYHNTEEETSIKIGYLLREKGYKNCLELSNLASPKSFDKKSPVKVKVVYTDGSYTTFTQKLEEEIKDLPYTVEFYKGEEKLPVSLKKTVKSNQPKITEKDLDALIKENAPKGFEYDPVLSTSLPFEVSETNALIKIVYKEKIFDLPYIVNYFKDNQKFDSVEKNVKSNNPYVALNDIPDKTPSGYKFDSDNSSKFPFKVTKDNKEIEIKYIPIAPSNEDEIAKDFLISEFVKDKDWSGKPFLWIIFSKEIPHNTQRKVKAVVINGKEFKIGKNYFLQISEGYYTFKDHTDANPHQEKHLKLLMEDAIEQFDHHFAKKDLKFELIFEDGSKSEFKQIPEETPEIDFDALSDGTYTLSYKVYVDGTEQTKESSIVNYFDKRAKLIVDGDSKKLHLLNHKFANLILDLALEKDGEFHSMDKKIIQNFKEVPDKVEYMIDFKTLNGVNRLAVMGAGPMQGHESLIGEYNNPKYRKVDIVFETYESGFSGYEVIQKEIEQVEKNEENLYAALDKNHVDENQDGKISPEELEKAEGISVYLFSGDKIKKSNMLDLRGFGITDISILKDLGPNVKGILLDEGNNIKTLPAGVFDKAVNLEYILLSANRELSNLPEGIFDKNVNLKYVTADGCNLGDLPRGIFKNNRKLQTIGFMSAGITSVPEDMIKNAPKLKSLYLSDNSIGVLPDDFFAGQKGSLVLKDVFLDHNELTTLPSSLGAVDGIDRIAANSNRIEEVPESLKNLAAITNLDLENNRISEMPTSILVAYIKNAKNNIHGVRLDLSNNRLTKLPVKEMLEALKNGKALTKFEVDKNYLKANLSEEEIQELKSLGVAFQGPYVYLPQKTLAEAKGLAQEGTIELRQRFDVLELYYWTLGDTDKDLGKQVFENAKEFEEYLNKNARFIHDIEEDTSAEEAIKTILQNKHTSWKVETLITKNNAEVIYKNSSDNFKEGRIQRFEDKSMKKGDRYSIRKVLYVRNVFGYSNTIDYSVDFVATKGVKEESKSIEIPVKAFTHGKDTESPMMNASLKPSALYEEKDGKHIYTIALKSVEEATVSKIEVFGKDVLPTDTVGTYNKSFTFESDRRMEKVTAKLFVKQMPFMQPKVDLVFDFKGLPESQPGGNQNEEPGGNQGNEGGSQGNQGGNQGNEGGSQGNQGGNQGNQGGSQTPSTDSFGFEEGVQYRVTVQLMNNEADEVSMGDGAFANNRSAYITKEGSKYKIVITTNPIKLGTQEAGVEAMISHDGAIESISHETATVKGMTYASKITFYVNQLKEKYSIGIDAGPMKDTRARLYFDLSSKVATNESINANTGSASAGAAVPEEKKDEEKKKEEEKDKKKDGLAEQGEKIEILNEDTAPLAAIPGLENRVAADVKAFTDLKVGAWYRKDVEFVVASKIFNGTSKNKFNPNKGMTRGMMVTILYRLAGEKEVADRELKGIEKNKYYAKSFHWAVSEGIIKGYENSIYKPNVNITKEEFITILFRYANAEKGKSAALNNFKDSTQISAWAKEAMLWAVENNLLQGDGTKLNPKGELTRAQAASIVSKFVKMQAKK